MGPYLIWTMVVGRELAVEGMEDVVGGARAIGFHVVVVEMVVVDEGAIEDHASMRCKGVGENVGGVRWAAAIAGGAGLTF